MTIQHVITIKEFRYFSSGRVYVAKCSCGEYESGKKVVRGAAEDAGSRHVEAKQHTLTREANEQYGTSASRTRG